MVRTPWPAGRACLASRWWEKDGRSQRL